MQKYLLNKTGSARLRWQPCAANAIRRTKRSSDCNKSYSKMKSVWQWSSKTIRRRSWSKKSTKKLEWAMIRLRILWCHSRQALVSFNSETGTPVALEEIVTLASSIARCSSQSEEVGKPKAGIKTKWVPMASLRTTLMLLQLVVSTSKTLCRRLRALNTQAIPQIKLMRDLLTNSMQLMGACRGLGVVRRRQLRSLSARRT